MTRLKFPTSPGTEFLADRWYYEPTYIEGKTGQLALFVRRIAVTETLAGNRRLRHGADVWTFPTEAEMVAAIEDNDLQELPADAAGDRQWTPEDMRQMVDSLPSASA